MAIYIYTAVSTLSGYLYVYCGVHIKWLSICTLRCSWHPVTVQNGFKASPWTVYKFPDPRNWMKNCQSWTMGWTSFPVLWAISFYPWKESSQKAWNNPVRFGLTLGVKRLTSTLLHTLQLPLDLVSQGQTRQRPCTKDYKYVFIIFACTETRYMKNVWTMSACLKAGIRPRTILSSSPTTHLTPCTHSHQKGFCWLSANNGKFHAALPFCIGCFTRQIDWKTCLDERVVVLWSRISSRLWQALHLPLLTLSQSA